MKTAYKKINVELVVFAEDADAVVAELNSAMDGMEEKHTIFGGEIETVDVEHSGARKRSAVGHTRAAGDTAVGAIKKARGTVAGALKHVI